MDSEDEVLVHLYRDLKAQQIPDDVIYIILEEFKEEKEECNWT